MWDEVVLTLDTDWAPEEVIAHSLEMLADADVAATVFATHPSPVLQSFCSESLEIGIHPNFNGILDGDSKKASDIIDELLDHYPEAVGERSHSRTISAGILSLLQERGFLYDANQIIPYQPELTAYVFSGFARFTDYWQDDVFLTDRPKESGQPSVPLVGSGLKIFNFHPVHIFLNTDCLERYHAAKPHYHDPDALRSMRNTERYGIGDFFSDTIAQAATHGSGCKTLKVLAQELLNT